MNWPEEKTENRAGSCKSKVDIASRIFYPLLQFCHLILNNYKCRHLLYQAGMVFLLVLAISSCNLRSRFTYLNNTSKGYKTTDRILSPLIYPGDRLEIKIAGLEPQSSLPFYFSLGVGSGSGQQGSVDMPPNVYLVNSAGEVSIPVLGPVNLAGKKLEEAEGILRERLKELIKSPVVSVRIFNFMVSVIGEVRNPGYYRIPNNRINVLEIMAMAGDVTPTADRQEILVLRRENNEMKTFVIDLTSTATLQSGAFELRQNDVVYVRPNKSGLLQPTLLRTTAPIAISIASLILTTLLFFR